MDGGTATLGDYLDRPVVLNFFASWCTPCKAEMPALESVHQQRPDIAFVGLAVNDTMTRAREIADRHRSDLRHWLGPGLGYRGRL